MLWNWQQPDWPRFSWDAARLAKAEDQFLLGGGVFLGAVTHLGHDAKDRLKIEAMSSEAVTTSEIEGEILDRDSVQSSIRRQLGLAPDGKNVRPIEQGVAEMAVDLYDQAAVPLDQATLFAWHRMLMSGRRDIRDVARYRTHAEPMQVISGKMYDPAVHFEAPPSSRVPDEMVRFIDWFNATAPDGTDPQPALTRAGTVHLYFECIHPFEDGNGRIGRALSEKVLAQALGRPTLTALAATVLAHRRAYYAALEAANKGNEITQWLAWFGGIILEAQQRTQAQVEFLVDKTHLLDGLRGQLNKRQQKVLLRVLDAGHEGFKGGLSAGNYVSIAKTSPATARRDLGSLVELGALHRTGDRRHARYHLTIPLRPVLPITINAAGDIVIDARTA